MREVVAALLTCTALHGPAQPGAHRFERDARSWTLTRKQLGHLDDHAVATCGLQKMVFLNGRRGSRCSLELIWQREEEYLLLGVLKGMGFEIEAHYFSKIV